MNCVPKCKINYAKLGQDADSRKFKREDGYGRRSFLWYRYRYRTGLPVPHLWPKPHYAIPYWFKYRAPCQSGDFLFGLLKSREN
jgi:hypothetical protein